VTAREEEAPNRREGGEPPPSAGGRADSIAEREAEAAAAEAAEIGGPAPEDGAVDPAERPLRESGQGVAEGFETAEEELQDIASHGDQHRFPGRHAPDPEERDSAAHGEPDQVGEPEDR
jgi:hypothetical protein